MRILLFLLLLFLLAALFPVLKDKEIPLKRKIFFTTSFIIFLLLSYTYTKDVEANNKQINEVVVAFKNGQTILCEGEEITSKNYRFTSGTLSFTKKEAASLTYSLDDCKVKP
jgi:hypothetical protein